MSDPEMPKSTEEPLSRAERLMMLEFGDRADFDDPRLERRRVLGAA